MATWFNYVTIQLCNRVFMAKEKKQKGMEAIGELAALPPRLIGQLAEEVAKTVATRLPNILQRTRKKGRKLVRKIENPIFLDTSAIIDGRIFDIIQTGLLTGVYVVLESILSELKHIADSQDTVRRERGRKGLDLLEKLKKTRGAKVIILTLGENSKTNQREVDEELIQTAKTYKGKIITCDYNLSKKASIQGVSATNINTLANLLKVTAVPGEALHIKVLHKGKDATQGVGYLDDGTMIVVEQGAQYVDKSIDVIVLRVIQTAAGRILFAKKI